MLAAAVSCRAGRQCDCASRESAAGGAGVQRWTERCRLRTAAAQGRRRLARCSPSRGGSPHTRPAGRLHHTALHYTALSSGTGRETTQRAGAATVWRCRSLSWKDRVQSAALGPLWLLAGRIWVSGWCVPELAGGTPLCRCRRDGRQAACSARTPQRQPPDGGTGRVWPVSGRTPPDQTGPPTVRAAARPPSPDGSQTMAGAPPLSLTSGSECRT